MGVFQGTPSLLVVFFLSQVRSMRGVAREAVDLTNKVMDEVQRRTEPHSVTMVTVFPDRNEYVAHMPVGFHPSLLELCEYCPSESFGPHASLEKMFERLQFQLAIHDRSRAPNLAVIVLADDAGTDPASGHVRLRAAARELWESGCRLLSVSFGREGAERLARSLGFPVACAMQVDVEPVEEDRERVTEPDLDPYVERIVSLLLPQKKARRDDLSPTA